MGNASGILPVNQIVTLGGKRQHKPVKSKAFKVKERIEKETKQRTAKRKDDIKLADEVKTTETYSKAGTSHSTNKIPIIKTDTNHEKMTYPDQQNANRKIKRFTENFNLDSNLCRSSPKDKDKQNSNSHAFCMDQQNQKTEDLLSVESSSSDFASSLSSYQPNVFLSSKHLIKTKLKTEWLREEKRLQMEYERAEQQIKNSQRDELRAKAEAQTWRDKLETLTIEHRKSLFRQAQTLHSRLHNAEKLLTYHEVRAKKLQMKNDKMKDLINSVKEEAKNLRIESEKRREVTQKIFDEKFSTVEKQLTKLKARLSYSKLENCSKVSPTPCSTVPTQSKVNQKQQLHETDGINHQFYSRYVESSQRYIKHHHSPCRRPNLPPLEKKNLYCTSSSSSTTPIISNEPRRKYRKSKQSANQTCCQPQKQYFKHNNVSPRTTDDASISQTNCYSNFRHSCCSSPEDFLQTPKHRENRNYFAPHFTNSSKKDRLDGQSVCNCDLEMSSQNKKRTLPEHSSETGSTESKCYSSRVYSDHTENLESSSNFRNNDSFYSSAGSSILFSLFKETSLCERSSENHSIKFINK